MLSDLWIRVRSLFRRKAVEAELDDELRFHLERQVEKYVKSEITAEEARRRARIELGGVEQTKEKCRDARGVRPLESLVQDIRWGVRVLRKNPGFTSVVVITLALGIGANAGIFSLFDAVMLRSIPVTSPQSLVLFEWRAHKSPKYQNYTSYGDCGPRVATGCEFSAPFFETVRAQAGTFFSGLTAFFGPIQVDLSGNGPASLARCEIVSGDFFSVLGVNVILGRPLGSADDSPNAPLAMVLSYSYWQSAFGGAASALGRTVRVNNAAAEIVGVASPRFTNLAPGKTQDFFLPVSAMAQIAPQGWGPRTPRLRDPYSWWLVIVGRKKPGVAIGESQAAASTIFRNEMLHDARPMSKAGDDPRIVLSPVSDALTGERGRVSSLLYVLMMAVGAILLIACANVAGLMLARSASRQREMALRLALGAGRGRIVRQLFTESVMLSVAGGALGVLVAVWVVRAIGALIPDLTRGFVVEPDARVLAFTLAVAVLAGIFFGFAPALRSAQVDLSPSLKEAAAPLSGGGATRGGRWFRLGDGLVVAQVALSVVVLVGAGLLVRTLQNLQEIDPGFDTRNVLLFGLYPTQIGYKEAQSARLFRDLRNRFATLPGVISASYSSAGLLSGALSQSEVHLEGALPNQNVYVDVMDVGPTFFATLHIPMIAGRGFTSADFASASTTESAIEAAWEAAENSAISSANGGAPDRLKRAAPAAPLPPMPVLINEAFARKYFPKENPVGKRIGDYEGRDAPARVPRPGFTVIGVVGDAKYSSLRRAIHPTMYEPFTGPFAEFELRTASNPAALISSVRSVVAHVDSNLPLIHVRTQTAQIEQQLLQERMMARISTFFALLALALACIGLYSLLSYEVLHRTREIGIRMALGAQPRDVLKRIVGRGILVALVGAAIGIGVAIGVTRFMTSMLYGVHANDPTTMAAVAIVLGLVALAACYIPASRATRVDPVTALRHE